jgi:hypothetical protein
MGLQKFNFNQPGESRLFAVRLFNVDHAGGFIKRLRQFRVLWN